MGLMEGDYPTPDSRKVFYDRLMQQLERDSEFESVALTNRFRMVFSGNGPIEIEGKHVSRTRRSADCELRAGDGRVLRRHRAEAARRPHSSPTTISTRGSRSRSSTPRSRRSTSATRARSDAASERPRLTATRSARVRGGRSSAWSATVRMLGPFNQPGVDETGFYVPFFSNPVGPHPAGAVRQPVRDHRGKAARRPARRCDGRRAAAAAGERRSEPAAVFRRHAEGPDRGFVGQNRIIATMFSIFGLVAIVLASVGMYGVMSFSVNQRRQEFGVRMALGAHHGRILSMVLRQGAVQLVLGLVLGLGLALVVALGRRLRNPERPVWRHRPRSADVHRRLHAGDDRVDSRDARSRSACDARRSDDCSSRRVKTRSVGARAES